MMQALALAYPSSTLLWSGNFQCLGLDANPPIGLLAVERLKKNLDCAGTEPQIDAFIQLRNGPLVSL